MRDRFLLHLTNHQMQRPCQSLVAAEVPPQGETYRDGSAKCQASKTPQVFAGVQAMRGIAALAVVCGHAVSARPDMVGPELAEGALTILASGVDIFFVISGFIIATTAAAQHDPLNFVLRRAVRIYPVYWLTLLAAFVSSCWIALAPGERPALDTGTIFAWTYPNWYVGPAWSLAFELHFYAVVAIILAIKPNRLFEILFAWLGLVIVALYFRIQLGICSHPLVLEFGAGVGIAYLLINRGLRFSPRVVACSAGLFFAGWYWIFVHGATDPQFARVPTYGLGAGLLIHAVVSAEIEGRSFSPVLQYLGKISYSLYMVHYPLVKWIANYDRPWLLSVVGTVIVLILFSIGLAAAMHILIEEPILRWGRRLSLMRRSQTSDAPKREGTMLPTSKNEKTSARQGPASARMPASGILNVGSPE
ncbi:acyltransferase [Bradyrhizobium sp. IC3069]|uniref:acyltransferase family protein n=1 Tax=unclassified Bradyrhizobium TaxID=2631580 RepID=UPI001CD350F8|nr:MULTISPECIES: acyltransferase [unclassified Bradyrhizobium]MCA1364988.1 acyltransferase [Bradyrhizobium sp. IC4059]MCA1522652.1 acyltransferase [Bradyrhizobium sp. IC3069]